MTEQSADVVQVDGLGEGVEVGVDVCMFEASNEYDDEMQNQNGENTGQPLYWDESQVLF